MSIWLSLPPPVHTSVLKKEIIYFGRYKYWPDKMWTIVRKRQMRQTRKMCDITQWRSVHRRDYMVNVHDSLWSEHTLYVGCQIFLCPYRVLTLSSGTVQQTPHYSADVTVRLAFAFCLVLFLLVCGAAGGSWVHWWSTQFLGFGSLHFLLDGLDVQLAFCGSCDRNKFNKDETEISCSVTVQSLFSSQVEAISFCPTFSGFLH